MDYGSPTTLHGWDSFKKHNYKHKHTCCVVVLQTFCIVYSKIGATYWCGCICARLTIAVTHVSYTVFHSILVHCTVCNWTAKKSENLCKKVGWVNFIQPSHLTLLFTPQFSDILNPLQYFPRCSAEFISNGDFTKIPGARNKIGFRVSQCNDDAGNLIHILSSLNRSNRGSFAVFPTVGSVSWVTTSHCTSLYCALCYRPKQ